MKLFKISKIISIICGIIGIILSSCGLIIGLQSVGAEGRGQLGVIFIMPSVIALILYFKLIYYLKCVHCFSPCFIIATTSTVTLLLCLIICSSSTWNIYIRLSLK